MPPAETPEVVVDEYGPSEPAFWFDSVANRPAMSPPPPAEWRTRKLETWRGRDWSSAWRDAKSEADFDRKLYSAAPFWTSLLSGNMENLSHKAGRFWADGIMPVRVSVGPDGRGEHLQCA